MVARAGPTSHALLSDQVRAEVRDPLLDASGNAKTNTRFSVTHVDNAIKHALMLMQREMRLVNPSDAYTYTDGTYTGGALTMLIPGASAFDPIVKVENIEDPQRPINMPSIPFDEIERYSLGTTTTAYIPRGYPYRVAMVDGVVEGERHILIRPRPTVDIPIRVWRIGAPLLWGTGENHPMAAHWEDLLVLLSGQELLSRLEGMTEDQSARLAFLLEQFRAAANRRRLPQRIRRQRVGWS